MLRYNYEKDDHLLEEYITFKKLCCLYTFLIGGWTDRRTDRHFEL